jgi:hypothetical protein
MKVRLPTDKPLGEFKTGWPRLDKGIAKANANPDLLFYKLQTNAYKFSWALIPLSVPFVWLLFLHRRRYRQEFGAYDHTVFVTYSITFMSMLVMAFVLLETIGFSDGLLVLALVLTPPCPHVPAAQGRLSPVAVERALAHLRPVRGRQPGDQPVRDAVARARSPRLIRIRRGKDISSREGF